MKVGRYISSFFATKLPVGIEAHNKWASEVLTLAGKDVPDNSSTRFALAVMLMHLGPAVDRKPKRFFAKSVRKAAINEVAHATAARYKAEQDEAKKAKP